MSLNSLNNRLKLPDTMTALTTDNNKIDVNSKPDQSISRPDESIKLDLDIPLNTNLVIIDDDDAFRMVLARSLQRYGYVVESSSNGVDGLELCQNTQPEYLILDLNINGESGLKLIQPILQVSPHTKIVLLTGYASIPTAVAALKLGAQQYLPKPANVADIIAALEQNDTDIPAIDDQERMSMSHLEWEYIQTTLLEHDGNISATAKALKMHRRTLQRKLAKKRPNHI